MDEDVKNDIAVAGRLGIAATTLEGYPQKAKRGDSASDNSEGRRETHFVARL